MELLASGTRCSLAIVHVVENDNANLYSENVTGHKRGVAEGDLDASRSQIAIRSLGSRIVSIIMNNADEGRSRDVEDQTAKWEKGGTMNDPDESACLCSRYLREWLAPLCSL